MSNNPTYDFSIDKENNIIIVKREFAAEVPVVWDAFTKSEILDKWWAPKPWRARTKSMDFREGGKWIYSMSGPEGEEHWSVAEYSKIEFQKRYTGFDAFTDAEGNVKQDMPQSTWEVRFIDKGQATLVEIHIFYDDPAQLEANIKMGFREGMAMAMENLDALLPGLRK
jgi:uncharacterized protein YndB with AHSA1/START domain